MRYTHFPTPWDELCSSQRVRFYTVLSSGGMVGIGLYPKEFDKVQVVDYIQGSYDEIHYFGDKYETDGNDYHLLHHESVIGHKVDSVEDTLCELEKL